MCVLTAEADIDALLEEKVAAIRKEVVLVTEELYAKERTIMRKETESLEDENALLKHQMTHLAEDLYAKEHAMRKRTESLEEENALLKHQMARLEKDLYAKEHAMRKRTENLEDENALLKSQLIHLAAQQRHDNVSLIAFSVVSHEDFATAGTNIHYPVTYVNIGNGWHNQTHAFRAPVAGVYYFTACCRVSGNTGAAYAHIMHTTEANQTAVATLYVSGDNAVNSGHANSVLLQLDALDYVSVHLVTGILESSTAGIYSTFSGFLLVQL